MSHHVPTEKTNIPSSSALWAALIFVGLLICAINFVKAEGGSEHGEHAAVEHAGTAPANHGETGAAEAHEAAEAPAATEAHTDSTAQPADAGHADTAPATEAHH